MIFGVIGIVGLGMALREMPLSSLDVCRYDVPARAFCPTFADALQRYG